MNWLHNSTIDCLLMLCMLLALHDGVKNMKVLVKMVYDWYRFCIVLESFNYQLSELSDRVVFCAKPSVILMSVSYHIRGVPGDYLSH